MIIRVNTRTMRVENKVNNMFVVEVVFFSGEYEVNHHIKDIVATNDLKEYICRLKSSLDCPIEHELPCELEFNHKYCIITDKSRKYYVCKFNPVSYNK